MSGVVFETLRAELEELSVPEGEVRNLQWATDVLAAGRTGKGDFEVFIRGTELKATSALVRRHLQFGEWRPAEGGNPFSANRIVLPPAPHFASIAALIVIELVRAGIDSENGPQGAFSDVEPIIEMAIRRGALPENVVIGLIGELTVLRQILYAKVDNPAIMLKCVDLWQGWQIGGRDFRIGEHSIEVKTTQATSSIHQFSGLHQLEPKSLPSDDLETMHLLSLGLVASTSLGEALPRLVESIVTLLKRAQGGEVVAGEFVRRVAEYGNQSGRGYDHTRMADWSVYGTPYVLTFPPRLYHLDDPAMLLLTREKLAQTFVQADGLAFTMHIPNQISDYNPSPDWQGELANMCDEIGL